MFESIKRLFGKKEPQRAVPMSKRVSPRYEAAQSRHESAYIPPVREDRITPNSKSPDTSTQGTGYSSCDTGYSSCDCGSCS